MSQPHLPLNVLDVPSPCAVPWKSMTGNDRRRYCGQCRKYVYNLSAMTAAEAQSFLRRSNGTPCVRFYRRLDGTVVTTDRCGNRVARTWRRFATSVAAMLVALTSLVGCDCSKLGLCTQGKLAPPPGARTNPPPADEHEEDDDGDENA